MRTLLSLVLIAWAGFAFAQPAQESPRAEYRWHQTVPAGPYSIANTATGTLLTTIPLVSLDGPAGTKLEFALTHMSSSTGLQSSLMPAAKRWRFNYDNWMWDTAPSGGHANISLNSAVGESDNWGWNVGQQAYYRKPGTRDDVLSYSQAIGIVVRHKDQTTAEYKQVGVYHSSNQYVWWPTKFVDTHNNAITITYSDIGGVTRPTQITDASAGGTRYLQLNWISSNPVRLNYVKLVFPGGSRQWDFAYDLSTGEANLSTITFPTPETGQPRPTITFTYDYAKDNILQVKDLNGNYWNYTYQVYGTETRLKTIDDPYSATNVVLDYAWTQNPSELTTTITDQLGRQTKHVYDSGLNIPDVPFLPIKRTIDPQVTGDPSPFQDAYVWNYTNLTISQYTDRRGNIWQYTYDADNLGNLLTETNPDLRGATKTYRYTAQNRVHTVIDEEGYRTIFSYAPATYDLIQKTIDPTSDPNEQGWSNPNGLAITENFSYNSNGDLQSTWKGNEAATVYSNYDVYGNAQTITNPLGKIWTYTFDKLNNKLTEQAPLPSGLVTYSYDNWNRLRKRFNPDSTFVEYVYDANSNLTFVYDENTGTRHWIEYQYDELNRVDTIKQKVSSTVELITTFGFDDAGNKTWAKNPRHYGTGTQTNYAHDQRNHLIQITYPDGKTRKFHYDGNGNRDWRKDGSNVQTNYVYDEVNRLKTIDYPSGTDPTFTYKKNGLRDSMSDATGAYTWAYNTAGLLQSSYQPKPNKTVSYTYYSGTGRKNTVAIESDIWNYTWNPTETIYSVAQPAGLGTVSFDYWDNDLTKSVYFGSVASDLFWYDDRNRVNRIEHWGNPEIELPTQMAQAIEYDYETDNDIQNYREIQGATTYSTTYTHDWAHRLLTEVRTGAPTGFNFNNTYAYDKNGNRTSVNRSGTNYTYGAANANDQFTNGDGFTFNSHDNNGNPTSITQPGPTTFTLTYDKEDRPTFIDYPGTTTDLYLEYNADGIRVQKKVGSTGTPTCYVYDGTSVIAEVNGTTGALTSYFTPGLAYSRGIEKGYYHTNALGSTIGIANVSQGIQKSRYSYDAYGIAYTFTQQQSSPYLFAGKHGYYLDAESGMELLGHRYYLPKLGRFLTQDPIGHEAGLNLYQYCANNPLMMVDPDGLDGLLDWIAGWGDTLTFGGTKIARRYIGEWLGIGDANEAIDFESGGYRAGQVTGTVHSLAFGVAGGLKAAAGQGAEKVTVYVGRDSEGIIRYIGQTKDIIRRTAEHGARFTNIRPIAGLTNLTRFQGKAVEQVLIEFYKLGKNGGQLANKINSIAKSNPSYAAALREGRRLLHNAKYPGF